MQLSLKLELLLGVGLALGRSPLLMARGGMWVVCMARWALLARISWVSLGLWLMLLSLRRRSSALTLAQAMLSPIIVAV